MSGGNFKEAAPSRAGLSPRRPAARRQRVFEVDPLGVGAPGQGPGGPGQVVVLCSLPALRLEEQT